MTFEEYLEEVKKHLIQCSYRYREDAAEECIQKSIEIVKTLYEENESAEDCAIDIGYCCG